jgi:hypothetical protein
MHRIAPFANLCPYLTGRDILETTVCRFGSGGCPVKGLSWQRHAASNVAEKGSEIATTASKQAKTFASELETLGRNNPLGAMAAAMMVGVLIGLIGLIGRGRI